jgi:hypothetical protein
VFFRTSRAGFPTTSVRPPLRSRAMRIRSALHSRTLVCLSEFTYEDLCILLCFCSCYFFGFVTLYWSFFGHVLSSHLVPFAPPFFIFFFLFHVTHADIFILHSPRVSTRARTHTLSQIRAEPCNRDQPGGGDGAAPDGGRDLAVSGTLCSAHKLTCQLRKQCFQESVLFSVSTLGSSLSRMRVETILTSVSLLHCS